MDIRNERLNEFEHENLIFDVIDTGPLDAPFIVLLHGFPETAKSWQATSQFLNEKGYRTFAINQRGYSLTAQPKGRHAYRSKALVEDIHQFLNILNEPVYLVGHDWGAVVAWDVALEYPEKIKHLTAVSVPHKAAFLKSMLYSNQLLKSYYMGLFQLPKVPEFIFEKLPKLGQALLKSTGMTEQQLQDFQTDMVDGKRIRFALNWYRGLPFSSNKNLNKKVTVPTLFIWGKHDSAVGAKSIQFNKDYVDAPYTEIILDATHWIPTQNAQQLSKLILQDIEKY
ncbi:alpha/beta fold hydrolase [Acinetobacter sp. 194]|uniref:alpha/beta fold hydrolase n=1 Tax=Acinetobacter shaoyimingii TaxID=2715164 RepID=UPI00140A1B9C|nr:alpha/beta fold hydrolase [Acinetobacter shaoyimingii]NHB59430.1 alpha/beta fold hydrolase [Acinetobacter shaoyimingii]